MRFRKFRFKYLFAVLLFSFFAFIYLNYFNSKDKIKENDDINIIKFEPKRHKFLKGILNSGGHQIIIYIHNEQDMISQSILKYGVWESWLVERYSTFIRANPGIQLLDLGSNIGVYTLVAADLGVQVVSVDANPKNIERLLQSIIENKFTENVKLCLNAVTNVKKEFVMTQNENNIGSQNIIENSNNPHRVKSIFINDLVPLFNKNQPVTIKIDIEGNEIAAFKKADYFFLQINVTLILMEWEWIKIKPDITFLLDFLSTLNFKPFRSFVKTGPLNLTDYVSWPMDVIWIKM